MELPRPCVSPDRGAAFRRRRNTAGILILTSLTGFVPFRAPLCCYVALHRRFGMTVCRNTPGRGFPYQRWADAHQPVGGCKTPYCFQSDSHRTDPPQLFGCRGAELNRPCTAYEAA